MPPLVGGTMLTSACPLPCSAEGVPGAPGVSTGVIEFDAGEAADVPAALVAVEVNV